jgi:hypothetical protein
MKRRIVTNTIISMFFSLVMLFSFTLAKGQSGESSPLPQFLFPSFSKSTVLLKDGSTWSANFNYQMVDEEMVFMDKGKYLVPEKPQDIDTIYLRDRPFVPVERAFYEVLLSDKISVLIQHKSKYSSVGTPTAYGLSSQTNAPTTGSIARTGNQVRTLDMPENVQVTPAIVFWVKVNGELHKFTSERQFIKIFPGKESQLKEFIKKFNINIDKPDDLLKLGKFCNEIAK